MIAKVGKVVYSTEESEIVKTYTFGSFGQVDGYEEVLYKNPKGLFFLYVNGGELSKHPRERIIRMGKEEAEKWLSNH